MRFVVFFQFDGRKAKLLQQHGVNFINEFMHSFYAHRSQKQKRDSQVKQLLALSGSAGVKAAHKNIDEIDP